MIEEKIIKGESLLIYTPEDKSCCDNIIISYWITKRDYKSVIGFRFHNGVLHDSGCVSVFKTMNGDMGDYITDDCFYSIDGWIEENSYDSDLDIRFHPTDDQEWYEDELENIYLAWKELKPILIDKLSSCVVGDKVFIAKNIISTDFILEPKLTGILAELSAEEIYKYMCGAICTIKEIKPSGYVLTMDKNGLDLIVKDDGFVKYECQINKDLE